MKRTLVPELSNLSDKIKKSLFNISFQVLEIDKYTLDYTRINTTGYTDVKKEVILREEHVCTFYGASTSLEKICIDGLDYTNKKELNNFLKNLEKEEIKQEKKAIKQNLKQCKHFVEDERKHIEEMCKMGLESLKNPKQHNILYTGSITDYMLSDYGLKSGASLGTKWWAFSVLKHKNRFLNVDAINSGVIHYTITNTLSKNPTSTLQEIEDNIEKELTNGFYKNNPHIKNIFKR